MPELSNHGVFEAKLTNLYAGELTPLCHEADKAREMALKTLVYCKIPVTKLSRGRILLESDNNYATTLGGQAVVYTTAFEAKRFSFERRDRNAKGKVISLIMNHDYTRPAAFIYPSTDENKRTSLGVEHRSASVVVYDEVNNPAHLESIVPILMLINGCKIRDVLDEYPNYHDSNIRRSLVRRSLGATCYSMVRSSFARLSESRQQATGDLDLTGANTATAVDAAQTTQALQAKLPQ